MQEILNDSGKLMFLAFLLVIFTDIIIGVVFLKKSTKFMESSIITNARILGTILIGSASYYEVEYNDRLGRTVKGRLHSGLPNLKKDDEIELRYDEENPRKVKINNKFHIFVIPIALLQAAFILVAILSYLVHIGIAKFPF